MQKYGVERGSILRIEGEKGEHERFKYYWAKIVDDDGDAKQGREGGA